MSNLKIKHYLAYTSLGYGRYIGKFHRTTLVVLKRDPFHWSRRVLYYYFGL